VIYTVPTFKRRSTSQKCNVVNIHTKFHPHPSVTMQVEDDITLRAHGTELLRGRYKYHRDKYNDNNNNYYYY